MKIFFYINAIHQGGAQRVMVNLAEYFSKDNDCTIITSFKDDWEYPLSNNVKRIFFYESKDEQGNFLKKNFALVKKLHHLIKKENPDILISFMAEPNIRSILASFGTKTKALISIRNDPVYEYENIMMRIMAKALFGFADGIVFQTEDAKRWFSKKVQNKSRVILNPVSDIFFNIDYRGNRKNIVTTGRLEPQKNHKLLIKAFSQICDKIEDDLYIYGDGSLREELCNLIKELNLTDRVHLPGAVKDVVNTIKGAKLFVLSSDFEGMPNSLMEAMAMGLPCISTDCPCGGPRMIIQSNENGILVKVNDEDKLASTMLNILNDENERNRIAINATLFSQKKFSSCIIYDEWLSYVCSIVGGQNVD